MLEDVTTESVGFANLYTKANDLWINAHEGCPPPLHSRNEQRVYISYGGGEGGSLLLSFVPSC